MRTILLAAAAVLALASCATASKGMACDRDCRIGFLEGLARGEAAIPATATATENGGPTSAAATWLTGIRKVDVHAAYAAEDSDQAIIAGTAEGADGKPAVFAIRTRFEGQAPSEVEIMVTRNGEVSLFPPGIPLKRDIRFDALVDPSRRTPAKDMVAAAEAYLDGLEASDGSKVPVTADCNRVENGVQTTHTARFVEAGCNSLEAFVYIPEVRDRRYPVVDEERGVVVAIAAFNIPGGDYKRIINGQETMRHYEPRSLYLIEAFKIIDGKIVQIEATMRNLPLGAPIGW